jgi:hypothetical protein
MPNEKKQTTDAQNLVAFLNRVSNVIADKVNPAFKSKYASLSEILDTVKAEAEKHDIAVHQTLSSAEGQVRVTTTFIHASGAVVDCGTLAFLAPGDAQKLGSAITYLRRQSLQTACGISTDVDDDGAKASGPNIGKGNYQREDDRRSVTTPWHHFIPADKLPKAKEYLVAKGWLPAEASIDTLGNQHQMVIAENQAAFLKAISK